MDLRPEVDLEAGMRVRHPRSGHDGHAAEGDVRSGGLERVECRRARHESRKWRPPGRRIKNPGRVGDPAGADDVPRGRDFAGGMVSRIDQAACTAADTRRRFQAPSPARATPAAAMPSVEGSGTAATWKLSIAIPCLAPEPSPLLPRNETVKVLPFARVRPVSADDRFWEKIREPLAFAARCGVNVRKPEILRRRRTLPSSCCRCRWRLPATARPRN